LSDRAILAVLLYHGLRRLKMHGKGGKVRYLPLQPVAAERIHQYLESSGLYLADREVLLFISLPD
jgi:site-specific recombinase XerC